MSGSTSGGCVREAWPDVQVPHACETTHVAGGGIAGGVAGHRVIVGSPAFVKARARGCATGIASRIDPSLTPVLVAVDGEIVAGARLGDQIRADAAASVASLRASGWHVSVLSGDASRVVAAMGRELNLPASDCEGGMSPEDKLHRIEEARGEGDGRSAVIMVGDGVNDAAAIAAASVGIGVHGGAEACLSTADIYLTRPGLEPLVELVRGAEHTMRVIKRNLAFSLAYNVAGAALAMSGSIDPLVAAIFMPASSLTVVPSSWRARTFVEPAA